MLRNQTRNLPGQRPIYRFVLFLGLAMLAMAGSSPAAYASLLSEWNLIVKQNVTTSSEVDGSALIGGNLTGTSNYSIHLVSAANGDGLAVGGNITAGNIQINNGGNLRLGGSNFGTVNLNGGGTTILDPTVSTQVAADFTFLNQLSAAYSALAPNGTMDGAGNFNAVPVNMGGQLVAVYNITAASMVGLGQLNLSCSRSASRTPRSAKRTTSVICPPCPSPRASCWRGWPAWARWR